MKWKGDYLHLSGQEQGLMLHIIILFMHTSHNYFESMLYNGHFIDEERSQRDLLKVTVRDRSL